MILNKISFISLLMAVFVNSGYAGEASRKLSALADSLIKDYSAKSVLTKATLAVFPLYCEGKLERQRVGFAASELILHRFVAKGPFTVVERGELARLLSEQKLQASGVVEAATTVRLSKILGAGVMLSGNVHKVGGQYQVNARLISVETAEVLVSGYTELGSDTFEEDAASYLVLVPEKQTLGLYTFFSYKVNANNTPPFTTNQATIVPKSFNSILLGYGLLYRPHKSFQINIERAEFASDPAYSDYTFPDRSGTGKLTSEYTAGSLSFVSEISSKWRYWLGGGIQEMIMYADLGGHKNFAGPFCRSGIEFRPQNRIGFGASLKYDLKRVRILMANNTRIVELSPLSFESNLTFYF